MDIHGILLFVCEFAVVCIVLGILWWVIQRVATKLPPPIGENAVLIFEVILALLFCFWLVDVAFGSGGHIRIN